MESAHDIIRDEIERCERMESEREAVHLTRSQQRIMNDALRDSVRIIPLGVRDLLRLRQREYRDAIEQMKASANGK
jgi:hypothetical protein